MRVGIPIADLLTGLYGAFGIMAALQARERTGRGQVVTTSLLEAMVGTMGFQAVRYLNGGGVPPPAGNHHPINAPYGVFRAKDGYLTIGATGEKRWPLFCRLLDAEALRRPLTHRPVRRRQHRQGVPTGPVRGALESLLARFPPLKRSQGHKRL